MRRQGVTLGIFFFKNRSQASQSARSHSCTDLVFPCTTTVHGCACIIAQPGKQCHRVFMIAWCWLIIALYKQRRPLKRRTFPSLSWWTVALVRDRRLLLTHLKTRWPKVCQGPLDMVWPVWVHKKSKRWRSRDQCLAVFACAQCFAAAPDHTQIEEHMGMCKNMTTNGCYVFGSKIAPMATVHHVK